MSKSQNTESQKIEKIFDCSNYKFGIVVSEWHSDITFKMEEKSLNILKIANCQSRNIHSVKVPGSFELPLAAKMLSKKKNLQGVICLGCVIKGETPHFDFISSSVSDAIMKLNLELEIPVIFGVLTVETLKQAEERINKGTEAAKSLIKMTELKSKLKTWI
tara:strand:+ start:183 stop:665 length:483 start_codon:yes stop_codon:yes gene_type:complete